MAATSSFLHANQFAPAGGNYEPQRQNNGVFRVQLGDADQSALISLASESFNLPTETSGVVEMHWLNESRKVAGKTVFEDITLTLKDFVDVNTHQACLGWRREVYNPVNGAVGLAANYKKQATVEVFAPNGGLMRRWLLIGCWPMSLNAGSVDHSSEDYNRIEMSLSVDKAYEDTNIDSFKAVSSAVPLGS